MKVEKKRKTNLMDQAADFPPIVLTTLKPAPVKSGIPFENLRTMTDKKMAESGGTTPKRLGAGDGVRLQGSAKKRVPTPSARKFCARVRPDPVLRLRLEEALMEVGPPKFHTGIKKSTSLAEFTPTKRKVKTGQPSAAAVEDAAVAALHATPRRRPTPFSASRRREGAVGAAYRRLLLLAWRRCRQRLQEEDEECRRRAGQKRQTDTQNEVEIAQLEMQIEVLRNLQEDESRKRADAITDYQRCRRKLEVLELENSQLIEAEVVTLKKSLENSHNNLQSLTDQLSKTQDQLSRKNDQRKALLDKLANCESQLHSKDSLITELRENLRNVSCDLGALEARLKKKEGEFEDAAERLEEQTSLNENLKVQVDLLTGLNNEMSDNVNDLEISLQLQIDTNESLIFENSALKETVLERTVELEEEKKKSWLKNTKEFALLSVSALQKIAHIMLPAYI